MANPSLYSQSFSRNIGILTEEEQSTLRRSTVAVAGLGGIGSNALIQAARMGIGRFRIADFDRYEVTNINRQHGANGSTLGELKAEVLAREVKAINGDAEIAAFDDGVTEANVDEFLSGADVVIDAIDFYAIESHLLLHRRARDHGRYVVMGSPVGFSACLQVYDPRGMSFEAYTGITAEMDPLEKQLRYACGVVPDLAHIDYFDVSSSASRTNFVDRTGPAIASALGLAASLVSTEVVLLLLGRRPPRAIPYTHQFDPFTFRYHTTYVAGGMPNYDPEPAIARIRDKGSLIPQVFELFYQKPKSEPVPVPGGQLYCKARGDGEPVLLLNPLGVDSGFWARQFYDLGPGFRVIAFDGRGCGASSEAPEGYSTAEMAADALRVLEHLRVQRAHVVGVALGGAVAQELALRWPDRVRSLVLASSYARADDGIRRITARWRSEAVERGMSAVFEQCLPLVLGEDYIRQNPGELGNLRTFLRLAAPSATQFGRLSLAGTEHDTLGRLGKIGKPTLVVHGERDGVVAVEHARSLAQGVPKAQLWVEPGQPHFLSWTLAAGFNARINQFWSSLAG